jgi:hypothetical protein
MKLTIVVLMALILSGCKVESIDGKDVNGVRHVTTDKGVDCVVYKFTAHYKGGAGISCNWQKYNAQK